MSNPNDKLLLICGSSGTGKSACLRNIRVQEGVMYLNTESNKRLPFKNKFDRYNITDPHEVIEALEHAETVESIHTIIVDSVTFLLDQYESIYIAGSANGMQAWSDFAQYFKTLMQKHVAESSKHIVFTAHTLTQLNDTDNVLETKVPVKGSLKNNGLEAYFSTVVATKVMTIKDLKDYKSDMLNITEEEEAQGFKHVFQTRLTKGSTKERIRSPMGMFTAAETFIDNDIQLLMDRLDEYYEE